MALKIGNNAVANAFVGSSQVRRAYKGGTLVYQGFGPASEQEFIQQTAAGGPAKVLKVYGKSVVNNQLVQNGDFSDTSAWNAISVSNNVGTRTPSVGTTSCQLFQRIDKKQGHKYLILATIKISDISHITLFRHIWYGGTNLVTNLPRPSASDTWEDYAFIVTGNADVSIAEFNFIANYVSGGAVSGDSMSYKKIRCIDLTLRFGAGNEPTSVDEALRLLGGDAFDPTYDPGSLQSNKTAELRAERVPVINVWDEEWEGGSFNTTTGENIDRTASQQIRSKNLIPVIGGLTYYFGAQKRSAIWVMLYDSDLNIIDASGVLPASSGKCFAVNQNTATLPANAAFAKFYLLTTYGATYNHDICINISDPAINGQYYPHWRGSLALNLSTLTGKLNGEGASVVVFPDGLRGVGTDRDAAYGSTGEVRFGKRAYQAGDESDTSVLTDGTNTIYPLATPLTYTLDTPLPTDLTCEQGDILQRVSDDNCPFVGEMKFGL